MKSYWGRLRKLFIFLNLYLGVLICVAAEKCANENCDVLISKGRTTQRYLSKESGVLSFYIDEGVEIYKKAGQSNPDLYGVMIGEKKGYVPKKFIIEEQVYIKDDKLLEIPEPNKEEENFLIESSLDKEAKLKLNKNNSKNDFALNPLDIEYNQLKDGLTAEINNVPSQGLGTGIKNIDISLPETDLNSPSIQQEHDEAMGKLMEPTIIDENLKEGLRNDEKGKVINLEKIEESTVNFLEETDDNKIQNVPVMNTTKDATTEPPKLNINVENDKKLSDPEVDEESEKSSNPDITPEAVDENIKIDQSTPITKPPQDVPVDNEDGNGNEGEENGSELDLRFVQNEEQKNVPVESPPQDAVIGDKKEVPVEATEEIPVLFKEEATTDSPEGEKEIVVESGLEDSDILDKTEMPVVKVQQGSISGDQQNIPVVEDEKQNHEYLPVDQRVNNENTPTRENVASINPTPTSDYRVIAGTTFYLDDDYDYSTTERSDHESFSSTAMPPTVEENHQIETKPLDSANKLPEEPLPAGLESVPILTDQIYVKADSMLIKEQRKLPIDILGDHKNSKEEAPVKSEDEFVPLRSETVLSPEEVENINEGKFNLIETIEEVKSSTTEENNEKVENLIPEKENVESLTPEGDKEKVEGLTLEGDKEKVESLTPEDNKEKVETIDVDFIKPKIESSGGLFSMFSSSSDSSTEKAVEREKTEEKEMSNDGEAEPIINMKDVAGVTENVINPKEADGTIHPESLNEVTQKPDIVFENSTDEPPAKEIDPLIANLTYIDLVDKTPDLAEKTPDLVELVQTEDEVQQILPNEIDNAELNEENISSKADGYFYSFIPFVSEEMSLALEGMLANPKISARFIIFLIVVAGTITLLYIIHLIIIKMSREALLLDSMNKIDQQKRMCAEENNNLKMKIATTNGQLKNGSYNGIDPRKLAEERELLRASFEEELTKQLEKVDFLENALDASVVNAEELHNMNMELLSDQQEASNFEDSVNTLQTMLDAQKDKIENLTSDLSHKTLLNNELRNESKTTKTKISKLESQIEQLTRSLEEANAAKQICLKNLEEEENNVISLRELLKESSLINEQLEEERKKLVAMRSTYNALILKLNTKDAECQVSKECLKRLQRSGNQKCKFDELFNFIEVKAKLIASEKERQSVEEQLVASETSNSESKTHLRELNAKFNQIEQYYRETTAERDQAQSKLDILSQYYEEKETKLKKELESQEGLRLDAEGSASTILYKIKSFEHELSCSKEQIVSLKNELEEQTKSYRVQLTNEEKKVQENWIAARASERRQEELRKENTQLRQTITMLQKEHDHGFSKRNGSRDNLSLNASDRDSDRNPLIASKDFDPMMMLPPFMPPGLPPLPPGMGMPPPPGMGMPPSHFPPHGMPHLPPPPHGMPPLPPPPMDMRGRMMSPRGYDRRSYSPGSEHSLYSDHRYSPIEGTPPRAPPSPSGKMNQSRSSYRRDPRSPDRRYYNRSPQDFRKPQRYSPSPRGAYEYEEADKMMSPNHYNEKTSTPQGGADR